MLAIVDMEKLRIVRTEGKMVLEGECNRCGVCCKKQSPFPGPDGVCKHYWEDTLDGKPRGHCGIYLSRPAVCALWPLPGEEIPEECGLYYVRMPDGQDHSGI